MSGSQPKGIPMTKEEVMLLVNLVETNSVVTSKATNAANNQLKDAAWQKITEYFNAAISSCPRRPEQLRLKWENLKKTARKRSSRIRMNNLKTGGGKPDYIPPDDALDKVAAILGATCDGYSVSFGGDAENQDEIHESMNEEIHEIIIQQPAPSNIDIAGSSSLSTGGIGDVVIMEDEVLQPDVSFSTPKPKKFFFSANSSVGKQKRDTAKSNEPVIRNKRNQAIAEYYTAKREKIKLEMDVLKYQKIKIELEVKRLGYKGYNSE